MEKDYKQLANNARKKVLEMIYEAQASHAGSNFSAIDLLTVMYDKANLGKGNQPDNDLVVISKGWIAASVYYFLSEKGLILKEDLKQFCAPDSKYIGLVEPTVEGIKAAGGSMGFGLPFGVGFALAQKIRIPDLIASANIGIGDWWVLNQILLAHVRFFG